MMQAAGGTKDKPFYAEEIDIRYSLVELKI